MECVSAGPPWAAWWRSWTCRSKKTVIAAERDEAVRAAWRAQMATVDPTTIIFLDETHTPTTLTPLRARAPRGVRAVGSVPRGRWQTTSWLATLTPAGIGPSVVVPGTIDGLAFDAFVQHLLAPTLRPGHLVVLDNLSVHKSPRARAAIEATGAHLAFLPTYSPDLNPIELAFAKIKTALRRAEARSFDRLVPALSTALETITATDAQAFYRAAGYAA
ncbi:MAG TPA: IS630 family transposase [Candidatus Limnocylindria bacterium]|nr:IS630 family transposase [Candidatus Limnocylindria bacterium]